MKRALIYQIENVVDKKVYIGSTIDFKNRWKCHRSLLRTNKHHSSHLQYAWNKYGEDKFSISIIEECEYQDRLIFEQKWMDFYKSYNLNFGYNICQIAEGVMYKKHSEETKLKISNAHKGKIRSPEHCHRLSEVQKGKTYSDEYKIKMSESTKGRIVSEETRKKLSQRRGWRHTDASRKKMSESCTGRIISIETRKKLSEAGKERKWTESQREKMMNRKPRTLTDEHRKKLSQSKGGKIFTITNKNGESFIFTTLRDAAVKFGLDISNIHKCLIGKARQTKGYYCKYKAPEHFGQI